MSNIDHQAAWKGILSKKSRNLTPLGASTEYRKLYQDITDLIQKSRKTVAIEVNSTVVVLYWAIGKRINSEVLGDERAEYGNQVVNAISHELTTKFGRGYSRAALFRMMRFSKLYPGAEIVSTLSRQLSWSHLIEVCQIDESIRRDFYISMSVVERWSVRALRERIKGMLFERTAISKKPERVIKQELKELQKTNKLTPSLVFKDPCFLNFIGLDGKYSEEDLENAVLDNIVEFIHEFGNDFCFVARQKRMSTKKKDRYLDLLFFHRGLQRLVAIELKLGQFEPEHKGQMEWYLRWLDKNERKKGEEKPVGIILCADKDQEDVEYLELDEAGIHVAQYFTELPSKTIMEERLHTAIAIARQQQEAFLLDKER